MKTAVITGIGKGIGKALAEKFLKEGYGVIGTALSGEADFANEHLTVLPLDLRSAESIAGCVEKISESGKKIDILINNAGVLVDEDETKVIVEKLRATLEVNLIGTIDFTERLLPLIERNGHVISISSSAGSIGRTGHYGSHSPGHYPSYKISKAALNMYTRTLAERRKGEFVVSSVHPGWVKTDIGGNEADLAPEEAAENIFSFAISQPETGHFWFKSEKFPW